MSTTWDDGMMSAACPGHNENRGKIRTRRESWCGREMTWWRNRQNWNKNAQCSTMPTTTPYPSTTLMSTTTTCFCHTSEPSLPTGNHLEISPVASNNRGKFPRDHENSRMRNRLPETSTSRPTAALSCSLTLLTVIDDLGNPGGTCSERW